MVWVRDLVDFWVVSRLKVQRVHTRLSDCSAGPVLVSVFSTSFVSLSLLSEEGFWVKRAQIVWSKERAMQMGGNQIR